MTGQQRIFQGGLGLGLWDISAVFDTNGRIARTYGFTLIQRFEFTLGGSATRLTWRETEDLTIKVGGLAYTGLKDENE